MCPSSITVFPPHNQNGAGKFWPWTLMKLFEGGLILAEAVQKTALMGKKMLQKDGSKGSEDVYEKYRYKGQ